MGVDLILGPSVMFLRLSKAGSRSHALQVAFPSSVLEQATSPSSNKYKPYNSTHLAPKPAKHCLMAGES